MSKWIPTWHCVPIDYNLDAATFRDITQRCVFTNNLRGDKIRLRFSNLYNDKPMVMDHVAVQACNRVTGELSPRALVTLGGSERIEVAPNSQPFSDEIPLSVTPQDDLLV